MAIPIYAVRTQFDPRRLGTLSLWLDGSDESTMTLSGSSVTEWRDKSGNGYTCAQTASTAQPTLVTGSNGRKALSFDGGDVLNNHTMAAIGTGAFSAFGLVSTATTQAFRTPYQLGRSSSAGGTLNTFQAFITSLDGNAKDGTVLFGRIGGNFLDTTAGTIGSSLTVVSSVRSSSNLFSAWINGAATTPATGDPNGMDIIVGYSVGAGYTSALGGTLQYWSGRVAALLVYGRAFSGPERTAVEQYLMSLR